MLSLAARGCGEALFNFHRPHDRSVPKPIFSFTKPIFSFTKPIFSFTKPIFSFNRYTRTKFSHFNHSETSHPAVVDCKTSTGETFIYQSAMCTSSEDSYSVSLDRVLRRLSAIVNNRQDTQMQSNCIQGLDIHSSQFAYRPTDNRQRRRLERGPSGLLPNRSASGWRPRHPSAVSAACVTIRIPPLHARRLRGRVRSVFAGTRRVVNDSHRLSLTRGREGRGSPSSRRGPRSL